MKINQAGLAIVKEFEGCRLAPYRDQAGILSIGWGHLIGQNDAHLTDGITQPEADALLAQDIGWAERMVEKYVDVQLNENQFSSLCSFTFNVGTGAKGVKDGFAVLKSGNPSTLRKLVNMRRWQEAADEFPKWVRAGVGISDGLVRRREAERALFLKPVIAQHDI